MKTAVSIKPVTASQSLTIIGNDGLRHSLNVGESSKIIAKAGEKYRIVKTHNAIDVLADDVVVTKAGDNLELSYADGTHVTLDGFYSANGSELELPANNGGIHTVTSSEPALSANESNYVYAHGNHDTLMSMTSDNHALQVAVADRTSVSDLPHYSELATAIAGVATDAMAGSGAAAGAGAAAGTTAAGTAAAATGLSTMTMAGIGAVAAGGTAAALSGGHGGGGTSAPADTTPPVTIAPAGFHFTDAGRSASDGLSSNPMITLDLAPDTSRWQYSLDNGTTWTAGSGHTITLAEGTYDKQSVQVKQFDAAGNSSISHMSTTPTIDSSAMVQLDGLNQSYVNNGNSQITAVGTAGEYVVTFEGYDSTGRYSVFVQKFNADGTEAGTMVQLEALGNTMGRDYSPQITAVGTTGEYVVTFYGQDAVGGDYSVYVQKFNADGTTTNNTMVQLEALNKTNSTDQNPQITAVGTAGEYAVTFMGIDSTNQWSIFVQKFDATGVTVGSMVQLDGLNQSYVYNSSPQITAVGTAGEYVVTFDGYESTGNYYSIFVQKFDASGAATGTMVQLDGLGTTTGYDYNPQVTAVGTAGEYVVSFEGDDANGGTSIFVQKFDANGAIAGNMVQLDGLNQSSVYNESSQVTAVGTAGEYVVTFDGYESTGNYYSIFVQKFDASGAATGAMVQLDGLGTTTGGDYSPQVTAVGTAGEYVVTFEGDDANGGYSIFVQKFHADGTVAGTMSQIDVPNANYDDNWSPQITAVGTAGEFAVTFTGTDSTGNDSIFVQKFRADGTYAPDMSNAMIIDTTAPSLAITTADTTNSMYPTISGTAEAGSAITLTIAGATYTATTASNGTWNIYPGDMTPTSGTFTLDPNGGNSVSVTATDAAGNVSVAATQTLVVDTVAPAIIDPTGLTFTDTGVSAIDGITSATTLTVALASDTATWNYSLDGGNNWNTGSGNTITLADGMYDKSLIQIQQLDAAGNSSVSVMSATATIPDMVQMGQYAYEPQITAVGTTGEYVVTYRGYGYSNGYGQASIYVQKFAADGTESGAAVVLDGNSTNGGDIVPQVTAVGTAGEYAVTFQGTDSNGSQSIFVQKFDATGATVGSMVQLDGLAQSTVSNNSAQITALTAGEYVVTFQGTDSTGDQSIFVQKFDANGAATGAMVQLEALGNTTGTDQNPQITALGTTGEYVVTFMGVDSTNHWSIFVQKFDVTGATVGSMVQLDGLNPSWWPTNEAPQITAVGTAGEYVVTFDGYDSAGGSSIFVQKFDVNGAATGAMVQLDALNSLNTYDVASQITAVGTAGEYVVAFEGSDNANNYSIYVQKFDVNGAATGAMVKLEAINNTTGEDRSVQIAAIGTTGEYAVTFQGVNSAGSWSIFVQKFHANGTTVGDMVQLDGGNSNNIDNNAPQISAIGTDGGYAVTYEGNNGGNQRVIFVEKFNADGTKAVDTHNLLVVDTTISATITSAAITVDSTPILSGTADVGSTVSVIFAGATYTTIATYGIWSIDTTSATPSSGTLAIDANGDNSVSVTATDAAGNVSTAATQTLLVDTVAPATIDPSGFTYTDTGVSTTDGVTSDSILGIAIASDTATWNYSLDGGNSWNTGSGNTITLSDGTYDKHLIQVQQFDAAGNSSTSYMSTTATIPDMVQMGQYASTPQITAVGTAGEYVVTYQGADSTGHYSIFVQKFAANGIASGAAVVLDGTGTNGNDQVPQVTAVGTAGAYAVTFQGADSTGNYSIFVQKFDATGATVGSMVQLDGLHQWSIDNLAPQISAVGTAGEYVVTFNGVDSYGGYSIFVQKFDATGATVGSMVQLDGLNQYSSINDRPQITAVGTAGEYVVTFDGYDSMGYYSIFVQKFDVNGAATGAMVQLDALNQPNGNDYNPQVIAIGTAGEYVVTFNGQDSTGNYSIFVQKFNADGTTLGSVVQLDGVNQASVYNDYPQITSVGTSGEFVVTFFGNDSAGDQSIFVQKFGTNGAATGAMVQLEALGNTTGTDTNVQIAAIGTSGEYAVTFQGTNSAGSQSIFVQKFHVDGTTVGDMVQLDGGNSNSNNTAPQISAVGTDGGYAVTYQGYDSIGYPVIFVQNFNANGTKAVDAHNAYVIDTTAPVFASSAIGITHDNITTSTVVYDAQTTEGDTGMHYSISGGVDMSQFAINATTGAVTFTTVPSMASPADVGANNVYDFTITATDLIGRTTDQAVALSVTPSFAGTTVTSNGVSFTLGAESVQNGKSYYYVTNINSAGWGVANHNVLDTAFNGGSDTVDTTVIAGVDDARTFVSAGVTYILPTATELLALNHSTPAGWQNAWYQSATQTSPDAHSHVYVNGGYSQGMPDTNGDYLVLQVLPA